MNALEKSKEEELKNIVETVYQKAQAREIHPCGSFDGSGRWYPASVFHGAIDSVRSPSRRWKYSYMQHCRTKKAIKKLCESVGVKTCEEALKLYQYGRFDRVDALAS